MTSPTEPPTATAAARDRAASVNRIQGEPHFDGPVVQARFIEGGIHYHAPATKRAVPRQLPPPFAHFTNREDDQRALDIALASGIRLIVVSGIGGVGKTAMAARWLSQRAFPDGQVYADLSAGRTPDPSEVILRRWLRAFGIEQPPADLAELAALWRTVTATRTVALQVDGVTSPDQVRPLLPAGPDCVTVVTSRSALLDLAVAGAALHSLLPLSPTAARELLARLAGPERVAAMADSGARLADVCHRLPQALVLVGARLASRPQHSAAALADSLVRRAALAHTHREDPIQMVIASALNETYNGLAEETKRLYRYLGTLPGRDISPDMAAAITGLPWPQAAAGLESLADEFLLEPSAAHHDGVQYRLVSAARGHARELALRHDPEDERLLVQRRLCEWFLSIAGQAQQRLAPAQATLQRSMGCAGQAYPAPFSDDAGAMAWLDTYESALLDILRVAEEAEWHELIWRTVDAWWPHFLRRHPYELWVTAHEIGLAAARRAGRDAAVRQMLASGAIGLTAAGRLDEAITWYTRALEAARAAGDIRDEGQALHGLGSCHRQAGRPDQARGLLMHAIARWEQCGYQRGIALSTIVLGEIALPDDAAHALDLFTRAHALLLELDDSFEAARALALKGHARVVTGEAADGIEAMEGALRMLTETGSIRWQARTLELLGHAYQDQGEPRTAGDCYRQAAALYERISPADAERVRELESAL
ncbi:tetratricopeptide repeat protein [Streptomyces misionensis]|uniref:tetratricopeptide repeat protein n=1 Tax=Streptomyces misionensis TaxID=67331 RepID=UPI003440B16A